MTDTTVSRPSLREALRAETRPQHESIEGAIRVSERAATLEGYKLLLARFYGYYAPIERCLDTPGVLYDTLNSKITDFGRRRKLPWLDADLRALGMSPAEIDALPECPYTPAIDDWARVVGCLYVLEGSTLGGQMMAKHLVEALGVAPERGAAFYSRYGDEIGSMWQAFVKVLEDPELADRHDAVIDSARETFATMERWFYEADG